MWGIMRQRVSNLVNYDALLLVCDLLLVYESSLLFISLRCVVNLLNLMLMFIVSEAHHVFVKM